MQKKDLKNMMRVKTKNGNIYVVVKDDERELIVRELTHSSLNGYNENLTTNWDNWGHGKENFDIVEIYDAPSSPIKLISFELGKLLWKRKNEKMITIDGKNFSESTIKKALQEYCE